MKFFSTIITTLLATTTLVSALPKPNDIVSIQIDMNVINELGVLKTLSNNSLVSLNLPTFINSEACNTAFATAFESVAAQCMLSWYLDRRVSTAFAGLCSEQCLTAVHQFIDGISQDCIAEPVSVGNSTTTINGTAYVIPFNRTLLNEQLKEDFKNVRGYACLKDSIELTCMIGQLRKLNITSLEAIGELNQNASSLLNKSVLCSQECTPLQTAYVQTNLTNLHFGNVTGLNKTIHQLNATCPIALAPPA